jgi:internalin A
MAATADHVRLVLKAVNTEVSDCPRLFILVKKSGDWRRPRAWSDAYVLTLWCEQPGAEHSWEPATYQFSRPKAWIRAISPYALLVYKTLRLVVPFAGSIPTILGPEDGRVDPSVQLELMNSLVSQLPEARAQDPSTPAPRSGGLTPVEGAGLRALRVLLFEEDRARSFGDLRRVRTPSGDFLWVCPEHYRDYDPGLPSLPR